MDGNKSSGKQERKGRGIKHIPNFHILSQGSFPIHRDFSSILQLKSSILHQGKIPFFPLFAAFPFLPFPASSWFPNFSRKRGEKARELFPNDPRGRGKDNWEWKIPIFPFFFPPTKGLIQLRKRKGGKKKNPLEPFPSHPFRWINAGKLPGAAR